MNSCGLMRFLKSSKQSENSLKEIDGKRKDFCAMVYVIYFKLSNSNQELKLPQLFSKI